jgi:hypothetical protein
MEMQRPGGNKPLAVISAHPNPSKAVCWCSAAPAGSLLGTYRSLRIWSLTAKFVSLKPIGFITGLPTMSQ